MYDLDAAPGTVKTPNLVSKKVNAPTLGDHLGS